MSDILDDWFGFDPPPPIPEAKTPARPAPTRKVKQDNVRVGVDERRRFTKTASASSGESKPERVTLIGGTDDGGIGINV